MNGPGLAESPFEQLGFSRSEAQDQGNLISGRADAFLSSPSFLTIARVSQGETFSPTVPVVLALPGVVASPNAWPGIRGAHRGQAWPVLGTVSAVPHRAERASRSGGP